MSTAPLYGLEVTKIYTTPKHFNVYIYLDVSLEVTKIYTTPKQL